MQIADGTLVAMDYALKDDDGNLIDQSQPGKQPRTEPSSTATIQ